MDVKLNERQLDFLKKKIVSRLDFPLPTFMHGQETYLDDAQAEKIREACMDYEASDGLDDDIKVSENGMIVGQLIDMLES